MISASPKPVQTLLDHFISLFIDRIGPSVLFSEERKHERPFELLLLLPLATPARIVHEDQNMDHRGGGRNLRVELGSLTRRDSLQEVSVSVLRRSLLTLSLRNRG